MRMIKLFTAALVVMAVLVCTVPARAQSLDTRAGGAKASATQTNTALALGNTVTGVTIYNSGANAVFIQFNAVATVAAGIEIPAGASVTFTGFTASTVGIICDTGLTATVYVYWTIR